MNTSDTAPASALTATQSAPSRATGGLGRRVAAAVAGLVLASAVLTVVSVSDLEPSAVTPSANAGWQ